MTSLIVEKEPITDNPNEILTVRQAAQVLKVSYSHMLRLIRGEVTGMPPVHHVRAGRSVRVRRGALTEWIRAMEQSRNLLKNPGSGPFRVRTFWAMIVSCAATISSNPECSATFR
jgi:excisionase family DNA binding protein